MSKKRYPHSLIKFVSKFGEGSGFAHCFKQKAACGFCSKIRMYKIPEGYSKEIESLFKVERVSSTLRVKDKKITCPSLKTL